VGLTVRPLHLPFKLGDWTGLSSTMLQAERTGVRFPMVSLEFINDKILLGVPGVGLASNINGYQEYFLVRNGGPVCRLTTLPPSCADCLEIWEPQRPGTLRAYQGL
jgi:hypothetical protein